MKIIKKPWGREEIWGNIQDICIAKTIHINMGQKLSRQYHIEKEEAIYVIRGVLRLEIGEKDGKPEKILVGGPGFTYHIKPGVIHRFCSDGGDVALCEISTNHLGDVVRLQDDYGRKDE